MATNTPCVCVIYIVKVEFAKYLQPVYGFGGSNGKGGEVGWGGRGVVVVVLVVEE